MIKKMIPLLILTLITVAIFVAYQVFINLTKSTISPPAQELMEPLDPNLDTATLENLKTKIK